MKTVILLDPTKVHALVPAEDLPIVLPALADSVRKTFLFGLCCSIACAIFFYLVPWIPLVASQETARTSQESSSIFTDSQGISDASISDESPKLPPLLFLSDQTWADPFRVRYNLEESRRVSDSGDPISFVQVNDSAPSKLKLVKSHSV